MSGASEIYSGAAGYATLDLGSDDTSSSFERSMADEMLVRRFGPDNWASSGYRKIFNPKTFSVKLHSGETAMFRPKDIVDGMIHTQITVDSMSWDKFREEVESRLDIKLHGKLLQAIVEDESGYRKPPIYVTDGISWRAVLEKFHYEDNAECSFIIFPKENVAPQKASGGWKRLVWNILRIMLAIAILVMALRRNWVEAEMKKHSNSSTHGLKYRHSRDT